MKRSTVLLVVLVAAEVVAFVGLAIRHTHAPPICGVATPLAYRDSKLIFVTHEEGNFSQLRAKLGSDRAVEASGGAVADLEN